LAAFLIANGYQSMSLKGGFAAWRDQGKRVVRAAKRNSKTPALV
jgi:rhodanese-related sulfurtransferase